MKVLVSHSWYNKNTAHIIAESLEGVAEVWLDVRNLKPGDVIQPTIDQAMEQVEVVLVLWSKQAAESDGVDAEIATAVKLKQKILPVLLEKSPIPEHPLLEGIYGINFDLDDPKSGLFRIHAGLMRIGLGSMDFDSTAVLNDLNSFEGFYQYVQEFRNVKGLGDGDSSDWALRSMEQCNNSFKSLSALRDEVGQTLTFIQDVLGRVEEAGDDRAAIQAILDEVIRNPKSNTKEFKVLISFVEGKLQSLSIETKPPVAVHPGAQSAAANLSRKIRGPKPKQSPPQRNSPESATTPKPEQREVARQLSQDYIQSAPASLAKFIELASAAPSMSLKQVANGLHAYLTSRDDLIPDDQSGLLGFIDDAWLIHNTIYRCIEAGFFGLDDAGIQWDRIVKADPVILELLPPHVRGLLEQVLMQYLRLISDELAQYQPQFMPQPESNSYAAFMGYGPAVGGTAQSEKTIDDVFYTVGDKMVYYGGS